MRYRFFILSLLIAAAGCTGTRISSSKLAELQSTAIGSAATHPADDRANVTLWYVGSKLVYDYYVYEYDDISTGQHVSHTYHVSKATDDAAPAGAFLYTTDRAKWQRMPVASESVPPPPNTPRPTTTTTKPGPATVPVKRPQGITLDDLHT